MYPSFWFFRHNTQTVQFQAENSLNKKYSLSNEVCLSKMHLVMDISYLWDLQVHSLNSWGIGTTWAPFTQIFNYGPADFRGVITNS